ncbi:hypothetical protein HPP92_002320 [Vanilla planifolia]|uniref:Uncharacterized protein n=1 Tax=Vanilla planifolia TaxID=51239 RepID=A0A835SEG2_VANPL|nr:hypothetical protein HPP92_002320 [Vanilla planifolia]
MIHFSELCLRPTPVSLKEGNVRAQEQMLKETDKQRCKQEYIQAGQIVLSKSLIRGEMVAVGSFVSRPLLFLHLHGLPLWIHCAFEGKYLTQDINQPSLGSDEESKQERFQTLHFSCFLPDAIGRGFIEVEENDLSSGFFPFIVAEDDICDELRMLESSINVVSCDALLEEKVEAARSLCVSFLHEIGWLLSRCHLRNRTKLESSSFEAFPLVRFRPDMLGPSGITPLHIAATTTCAESMLNLLTDDPGQDCTGLTPEVYAIAGGHESYILLMLKKINKSTEKKDFVVVYIPAKLPLLSDATYEFCKLCEQHLECRSSLGRSILYRPMLLSMVGIAALVDHRLQPVNMSISSNRKTGSDANFYANKFDGTDMLTDEFTSHRRSDPHLSFLIATNPFLFHLTPACL